MGLILTSSYSDRSLIQYIFFPVKMFLSLISLISWKIVAGGISLEGIDFYSSQLFIAVCLWLFGVTSCGYLLEFFRIHLNLNVKPINKSSKYVTMVRVCALVWPHQPKKTHPWSLLVSRFVPIFKTVKTDYLTVPLHSTAACSENLTQWPEWKVE